MYGTPRNGTNGPSLGINAPARKRFRLHGGGFQEINRVVHLDTDSEEDIDVLSRSTGTSSEHWYVTCPRCGCDFATGPPSDDEEVDPPSPLGTGPRLAEASGILLEERNESGGPLGTRNGDKAGPEVGPPGSSAANPIRVDDDPDSE